MKTISVIIPNYNNADYLSDCIDSIMRQTYPISEIIIVDDCSTDHSAAIINEIQKKVTVYPIKLIQLKTNSGVSKARNIGLKEAKGEYITFLDSDDVYFDTKKIEREMGLVDAYGKRKKEIAAYSKVIHINEKNNLINNSVSTRVYQGNIYRRLLATYYFPNIPRDYCIRTNILRELGGFKEDMALYEDYELTLRVSDRTEFYCTNEPGTGYRIKSGGLSNKSWKESNRVFWHIFRVHAKNLSVGNKTACYIIKFTAFLKQRCKTLIYNFLVRQSRRN